MSVDRFVYVSATGASERASVAWLRDKARAEALLRTSGLPFVILRPGPVLGPTDRLASGLARAVQGGDAIRLPVFCRGSLRPIAASDLAIALATALDHHAMVGRTIDVGIEPAVTLAELLEAVGRRLGRRVRITRWPGRGRPLSRLLADAGGETGGAPEVWLRWFSISDAVTVDEYDRLLPMRRVGLDDALRDYPWGPPPPQPGEPLPTLAPSSWMPPFIPGAQWRDDDDAEARDPAAFGRVDPFGKSERESEPDTEPDEMDRDARPD